jgi:DNA-binding NtrC family response regulator
MEILVIDDEEAIVEMTSITLEDEGYQVHMAYNGEEGLKVYRENQEAISIVLIDLNLPDMGGLDFLKTLRDTGFSIKALVMSGDPQPPELSSFGSGAVIQYLQKPFSMSKMVGLIRDFDFLSF